MPPEPVPPLPPAGAFSSPIGLPLLHAKSQGKTRVAKDRREKELIALGIGLAVRCEGCIYSHVEKCLKAGATPEQIQEVAGVAVMMQGGPTYTWVPKVLEALDHFASLTTPVTPTQASPPRPASAPAAA